MGNEPLFFQFPVKEYQGYSQQVYNRLHSLTIIILFSIIITPFNSCQGCIYFYKGEGNSLPHLIIVYQVNCLVASVDASVLVNTPVVESKDTNTNLSGRCGFR